MMFLGNNFTAIILGHARRASGARRVCVQLNLTTTLRLPSVLIRPYDAHHAATCHVGE